MRRRAAHLTAWWLPCVRLPAAEASPYDGPNTGPVFIAVRMSVLTNLGEGISVPVIATQVCVTCRRPGETPAGWPALRGWLASPAAVRVAHASQLQLTACSETGGRSVTLSVRADGLSQRRHRHFRRLRRQPGPRGPALPHPPLLLGRCVACCCRLGGWSAASCRQRCRLQCSMSRGVTPARRLRPALLPSQCAGMTPDGVRSMRPTLFSDFFYLLGRAEHKDRRRRTRRYTVKLTRTGVVYDLGKDVGSVKILGLADTGARRRGAAAAACLLACLFGCAPPVRACRLRERECVLHAAAARSIAARAHRGARGACLLPSLQASRPTRPMA